MTHNDLGYFISKEDFDAIGKMGGILKNAIASIEKLPNSDDKPIKAGFYLGKLYSEIKEIEWNLKKIHHDASDKMIPYQVIPIIMPPAEPKEDDDAPEDQEDEKDDDAINEADEEKK